ncbi:MAG: 4Fe-4S binding protein [Candidatus Bathyarchaeia archaeon]
MVKIRVNYAKCVGETGKICVEICPVSIFRDEGLTKPEIVNEESCIVCRTCQFNCPGQAIEISA